MFCEPKGVNRQYLGDISAESSEVKNHVARKHQLTRFRSRVVSRCVVGVFESQFRQRGHERPHVGIWRAEAAPAIQDSSRASRPSMLRLVYAKFLGLESSRADQQTDAARK